MASPRLAGARSVAGRPSMRISPPETSSSPAIRRSSVDLPQPEGADEDHELAVLDGEVQGRDDLRVAEALPHAFERDASHLGLPYFTAPKVRPRTSWRCENHPMTRMGAMAMVEAAESLA